MSPRAPQDGARHGLQALVPLNAQSLNEALHKHYESHKAAAGKQVRFMLSSQSSPASGVRCVARSAEGRGLTCEFTRARARTACTRSSQRSCRIVCGYSSSLVHNGLPLSPVATPLRRHSRSTGPCTRPAGRLDASPLPLRDLSVTVSRHLHDARRPLRKHVQIAAFEDARPGASVPKTVKLPGTTAPCSTLRLAALSGGAFLKRHPTLLYTRAAPCTPPQCARVSRPGGAVGGLRARYRAPLSIRNNDSTDDTQSETLQAANSSSGSSPDSSALSVACCKTPPLQPPGKRVQAGGNVYSASGALKLASESTTQSSRMIAVRGASLAVDSALTVCAGGHRRGAGRQDSASAAESAALRVYALVQSPPTSAGTAASGGPHAAESPVDSDSGRAAQLASLCEAIDSAHSAEWRAQIGVGAGSTWPAEVGGPLVTVGAGNSAPCHVAAWASAGTASTCSDADEAGCTRRHAPEPQYGALSSEVESRCMVGESGCESGPATPRAYSTADETLTTVLPTEAGRSGERGDTSGIWDAHAWQRGVLLRPPSSPDHRALVDVPSEPSSPGSWEADMGLRRSAAASPPQSPLPEQLESLLFHAPPPPLELMPGGYEGLDGVRSFGSVTLRHIYSRTDTASPRSKASGYRLTESGCLVEVAADGDAGAATLAAIVGGAAPEALPLSALLGLVRAAQAYALNAVLDALADYVAPLFEAATDLTVRLPSCARGDHLWPHWRLRQRTRCRARKRVPRQISLRTPPEGRRGWRHSEQNMPRSVDAPNECRQVTQQQVACARVQVTQVLHVLTAQLAPRQGTHAALLRCFTRAWPRLAAALAAAHASAAAGHARALVRVIVLGEQALAAPNGATQWEGARGAIEAASAAGGVGAGASPLATDENDDVDECRQRFFLRHASATAYAVPQGLRLLFAAAAAAACGGAATTCSTLCGAALAGVVLQCPEGQLEGAPCGGGAPHPTLSHLRPAQRDALLTLVADVARCACGRALALKLTLAAAGAAAPRFAAAALAAGPTGRAALLATRAAPSGALRRRSLVAARLHVSAGDATDPAWSTRVAGLRVSLLSAPSGVGARIGVAVESAVLRGSPNAHLCGGWAGVAAAPRGGSDAAAVAETLRGDGERWCAARLEAGIRESCTRLRTRNIVLRGQGWVAWRLPEQPERRGKLGHVSSMVAWCPEVAHEALLAFGYAVEEGESMLAFVFSETQSGAVRI